MINEFDLSNYGLSNAQQYAIMLHIMTQFSAAMGHRAFIPGVPPTYGNLCITFVGETGCGKGISHRFASTLFDSFQEPFIAPVTATTNAGSMKALLMEIHSILAVEDRRDRGEVRIYHINEEFAGELRAAGSNYQSRLSVALCKLTDGSAIKETFGRQKLEYPLIHYAFMGHIPPKEIQRCMREHLINGGCANRILWLYMPEQMDTILPTLSEEELQLLKDKLAACIEFASHQRLINMEEKAKNIFNEYLTSIQEEQKTTDDSLMRSMIVRFPMHVKKVALVTTMLNRKAEIDSETIESSISLVESSRAVIKENFVPAIPNSVEHEILNVVRRNGKIRESELIKELVDKNIALHKLKNIAKGLVSAGILKFTRIEQEDGSYPPFYCMGE